MMGDPMASSVFKPRYTPLVYALVVLYAAPWLYSLPNAVVGRSTADWRLFWLLAGTVWALAGLLHMKGALVKRIAFGRELTIEMTLQRPYSVSASEPVRIYGETVLFSGHVVLTRYLANAGDLFAHITSRADKGRLNLVYEERGRKDAGWSVEKNLLVLVAFALYMMGMLALRLRPVRLIGPATDALLLGLAILLPVLLAVKLFRLVRERALRSEEAPKWT
jgi:hypothetical protein